MKAKFSKIPILLCAVMGLAACDPSRSAPAPNQEKPGRSARNPIPQEVWLSDGVSPGKYICLDNHVYYVFSFQTALPIFTTRSSQPDDAMECPK